MQVSDRISTILRMKAGPIWTISADATVYDALALMAEQEIGALPVLEGLLFTWNAFGA